MRWSAIALGALALIALETLVVPDATGQAGANRVGGIFGWAASITRRFIDPTLPGITDRGVAGSTSTGLIAPIPGLGTNRSGPAGAATTASMPTGGPCAQPSSYPSPSNIAI